MIKKYFTEEEYSYFQTTDDLLYKTLELILRVFPNKNDKGGFPYFNHLFKVYLSVTKYSDKIVALLHDIIEDTDITYEDLLNFGYPNDYIETLKILTKNKGEYYPDYIERIIKSENVQALSIKLADLKHNMDISRIEKPTINDYVRINERYLPAYSKISEKLEELMKKGEKNVRY